ncbi:S8 family peptidase [Malikia sp.]|uniref:S8 family peptidase n=1 Tax=Malikia sp. TaxID=2070706 RepID=UPI00262C7BE8|nr:S8 family peptidase [Malikia sp.]MDD2728753.1 S8 family peptidase [Malikia sp.]
MIQIARTGLIAWGLTALAGALSPASIQAAVHTPESASARLVIAPDARLHQRLIVKLRPARAGVASIQTRTAALEIGDLAQRMPPNGSALGSVHFSLHKSLGADLHVAATERRLTRTGMQQLVRQLNQDPRVEYAEIDEPIYPQFVPNDAYYGTRQWNLQPPAPGMEGASNLPGAWDFARGAIASGPGVVVAVLDTGIRPHAELAGRILPGHDFVSDPDTANDQNGQWDSDPSDPGDWVSGQDIEQAVFAGCTVSASSWHGTMMAGTIAAMADDGRGIAGIAPAARILPVRVFGKCGGYVSDVIAGVFWAVGLAVPAVPSRFDAPAINPNRARVINLSMGADGSCGNAFQEAVDRARERGALVVAAAGNHEGPLVTTAMSQPANCRGVISVTAHTRRGDLASYSNASPDATLSAPGGGQGVKRLTNDNDSLYTTSNSYDFVNGTSIAAAHVSGVAALLLGQQPNWTPDQVQVALMQSARAYPDNSYCAGERRCGAGMLDAAAAVNWLQAHPAPELPAENPSSGGGGSAGWPELLALLSAALLVRFKRGPRAACQPHESGRAQSARQSGRV